MEELSLTGIGEKVMEWGGSDCGCVQTPDGVDGLYGAVSIAVRLSESVLTGIAEAPTHAYFHHYRTVNAFLDSLALKTGLLLQRHGWRYFPIAASQSVNDGGWNYQGLYSHKKAACLAGMGRIGRSALFLHREYGPAVRLVTVFTDHPMPEPVSREPEGCGSCRACVVACPAMAIKGPEWSPQRTREELFDAAACSRYMKEHFKHIGRGSVCGICVRTCLQANGHLPDR